MSGAGVVWSFVVAHPPLLPAYGEQAPYNVVIHSAPPGVTAREMHWHVEVIPRTSVIAGFELGSGVYANAVAPEQAARVLREA